MTDYDDRTSVELKVTVDTGSVAALAVGLSNPELHNEAWVDAVQRGVTAFREACEGWRMSDYAPEEGRHPRPSASTGGYCGDDDDIDGPGACKRLPL